MTRNAERIITSNIPNVQASKCRASFFLPSKYQRIGRPNTSELVRPAENMKRINVKNRLKGKETFNDDIIDPLIPLSSFLPL